MQYTNFLRDTKEDWEKYRRIYLPIDELKKHGLSHKSIIAYCTKKQSPENHRKQFMKEQIQKTRKIYRTSEKFILHLNTSGQLPVRMALSMYEAILDNIEQKDYNVF